MAAQPQALTDLLAEITLDDGRLLLEGTPTVILPAAILTIIYEASMQILGRGANRILYMAGEQNGREVVSRSRAVASSEDHRRVMEHVAKRTALRGLGVVELHDLDLQTGTGELRVRNSALAERPSVEPTCYLAAGFWAGIVAALVGRDVTVRETACAAVGAEACTFVIAPST